jgi:hypothetical protein
LRIYLPTSNSLLNSHLLDTLLSMDVSNPINKDKLAAKAKLDAKLAEKKKQNQMTSSLISSASKMTLIDWQQLTRSLEEVGHE